MTGLEISPLGTVAFILVAAAALLGTLRLLLGPTVPDRVVAADTLSVITTSGLAWLAAVLGSALYLDIALVYGALAFVGVVAVARAIEKGEDA
ncbi:MAG: cation:proton antiporter [Hyphomicrobiales bacterium]|nr:cation:proton antiporter [Hyphomicrobiales bacterium]MCP5371301.1 cation:proton antiporter [Hyphomicrobiales bacterium]